MARDTIDDVLDQANQAQQRVGEIYTIITNEVNADATLDGLDSTSKTAEFNLWKYVMSAMSWIQEQVWIEKKAEIQQIVDNGIPGTDRWLQKEILKFQYGDTLLFNPTNAKYYYAVIDETKQIVKRCAVVSNGGLTQVKVAKDDGSGNPIALSGPELSAFTVYLRRIQWAGSNIGTPISFNSDKLNAPMTVYYNGTIKLDDLKPLVQAAYNAYLGELAFNGEYKISAHQDSVQRVANVSDVVVGIVQAKADAGSYSPVTRIYYPVSGYIERDGSISFDTMITYVPQ